jgi:hypothetical protein
MQNDQEQIKLLSIFHYVVAGIGALFASFPILHLVIGISALTGRGIFGGEGSETAGSELMLMGLLFTIIPLLIILIGWGFAVCMVVAGRFLMKKQHYMFCMVMAGLSCLFMPFGTVLGVFTLVVLTRQSVKDLFTKTNPMAPEN